MSDLKMPELNSVLVAGNLTKDPIFRQTSNSTPVVNFSIAANRKYKDSTNQWQEDVCYVGVVAWNKLAESCKDRLKKGSAVLVDGELQSRSWKTEDGHNRSIVEIKAKRIQFLNKLSKNVTNGENGGESVVDDLDYEDNSFDKFLSDEESELLNNSHN
ncbi:MAG: single-stranded DNA-binding protein [Ignavibacteriales bacterium]|nr:MAG: single-stranded DNA-binding protein [Ignavibacteriales bacterium]